MSVGFFPAPKAGETFYSVCAQYHRATGSSSPEATSRELLGLSTGFKFPDLPICLAHFSQATGCEFDGDVLSTRSGLGPHLALMGSQRSRDLLEACFRGSPVLAKARSGLSRYTRSAGLLKFCSACLAEQLLSADRTSHWSAAHQCAGVWICEDHRKVLSYVRHPGTLTFGWKLPHEVAEEAETPKLGVEQQLEAWKLTHVMGWLAASRFVSTFSLQIMLRWRLRLAGRVRTEQKWHRWETDHVCECAKQYALSFGVPDVVELGKRDWMLALLGDARHYDALAWGVAMAFSGSSGRTKLAADYLDAHHRTAERELFNPERNSQNTAPALVYEAFDGAASVDEAAARCPLNRGELLSWLRRDARLHAHWHMTSQAARHNTAVRDLTVFVRQFPSVRRVDVLRHRCASYRWLEAHDPDLLDCLLPQPALPFARQLHFGFPLAA